MRKDEDDDWRFEPPPKSLRVERIRAKTRTSLREKREKRERKERERRESAEFSKKKRTKKDEKTLALPPLPSAFCLLESKIKEKEQKCFAALGKLFPSEHDFLSSFCPHNKQHNPTTHQETITQE
jgi:hypothetical protein